MPQTMARVSKPLTQFDNGLRAVEAHLAVSPRCLRTRHHTYRKRSPTALRHWGAHGCHRRHADEPATGDRTHAAPSEGGYWTPGSIGAIGRGQRPRSNAPTSNIVIPGGSVVTMAAASDSNPERKW